VYSPGLNVFVKLIMDFINMAYIVQTMLPTCLPMPNYIAHELEAGPITTSG